MSEDARREYEERLRRLAKKSTPEQLRAQDKIESEAARKELYTSEPVRTKSTPRESRFKTPTTQPVPGSTTIINLTETANRLTGEAGYTERTSLSQKPVKPTFKQMKARVGLALIEPIIGGAEEATFGIGTISQSRNRPATALFRVTGGLLTPTAADAVFNYAIGKMVTGGQKGRKILAKLLDNTPDPMWNNVAIKAARERTFESIGGARGLTTTQIRESFTPIKKFLASVDDIAYPATPTRKMLDDAKKAVDTLDTAELLKGIRRKQGQLAGVTVEDVRMLEKIKRIDSVTDFTTADLRNTKNALKRIDFRIGKLEEAALTAGEKKFLETEIGSLGQSTDDIRNRLSRDAALKKKLQDIVDKVGMDPTTARMAEVIEDVQDLTDFTDPYEVWDAIDFVDKIPDHKLKASLMSSIILGLSDKDARKMLDETTSLTETEIDNVIEQLRKPAPRQDQPQDQIPDIIPDEIEDTIPDEVQEPDIEPPIQITDPIQDIIPDTPTPTIVEPQPPDEPIDEPEPIDPTPVIPFKLKTEKRKKLNLKLFNGPKTKYRVTLRYQDKTKQTRTVEARSHPEAIAKAEMGKNRSKALETVESERVR